MQKYNYNTHHTSQHRVALIAGSGILPVEAARRLARDGIPFFILSLFPENNGEALTQLNVDVISESVLKLSKILRLLKQRGTTDVLFVGKVDKRHLLGKLSYDWLLTKLLAKAVFKRDSEVMQLLIHELEKQGIETLSQREVLDHLFIPPGVHAGKLSRPIEQDVALGIRVAEQLSQADIGQTVVVKQGMVLAVEAIEGTDECIARGIQLGNHNVVVCKTARTTQSDKFDIPTLGPETLAALPDDTVRAFAWHSRRTMIADYEAFIQYAQEKKITLISLE